MNHTIIKQNEIRYPENSINFEKRNKKVFEYIKILICAHMETCIYYRNKIL